jgi:sulfur carrier protein
MKLTVNGETQEFSEVQTVQDLVRAMGLDQRPVSVEVNRRLVRHDQRDQHPLNEGDTVELVSLVGGG